MGIAFIDHEKCDLDLDQDHSWKCDLDLDQITKPAKNMILDHDLDHDLDLDHHFRLILKKGDFSLKLGSM